MLKDFLYGNILERKKILLLGVIFSVIFILVSSLILLNIETKEQPPFFRTSNIIIPTINITNNNSVKIKQLFENNISKYFNYVEGDLNTTEFEIFLGDTFIYPFGVEWVINYELIEINDDYVIFSCRQDNWDDTYGFWKLEFFNLRINSDKTLSFSNYSIKKEYP